MMRRQDTTEINDVVFPPHGARVHVLPRDASDPKVLAHPGTIEYEEPHGSAEGFSEKLVFEAG